MKYSPRVCIPSREGTYERNLCSDDLLNHKLQEHGINYFNVVFLIISWTSLIGDSPIGDLKPNRVINSFLIKAINDLFGVIATYSELAHEITKSLNHGENGIIIEPYLKKMEKTPVYREYLHFLKFREASSLRYVLSFLSFGKKLYYRNEELDAVAFRKWQLVEDRIGNLTLPPFVQNLSVVIHWIFEHWDCDYFLPKHGNGAVAERGVKGLQSKNTRFAMDKKISYLYLRDRNIFSKADSASSGLLNMSVSDLPVSRLASRLKFVPKDWKTTRSICMEPIVFQWAQQGVRLWYETYLSKSILSNHVFLHDQSVNQLYARIGSHTTMYDTIDLSSASDSVSWSLVKAIFPPKVLKHLMATRTSSVEAPNGDILKIHKYAPMGSALCFPIQSTLYAAIVIMVGIARAHGRDWRKPNCFEGIDISLGYKIAFNKSITPKPKRFLPFLCYGDDIICDKRMTSNTIEALICLGFEVNKDKSYTGSQAYRESCGAHYFDGIDVTPYYFKVKQINRQVSIVTLAGIVDHANRALYYGYTQLRKHLIQFCLFYPVANGKKGRWNGVNSILFSSDANDSFAILCAVPRNSHLRKRSFDLLKPNKSTASLYQRDEYLSIVPGPSCKKELSEELDNYLYTQWWRSLYHGGGIDSIESTPVKADVLGVDVRRRWTAV